MPVASLTPTGHLLQWSVASVRLLLYSQVDIFHRLPKMCWVLQDTLTVFVAKLKAASNSASWFACLLFVNKVNIQTKHVPVFVRRWRLFFISCDIMPFPHFVFNVLQGRKVRTKEPPRERPKDPEDSGLWVTGAPQTSQTKYHTGFTWCSHVLPRVSRSLRNIWEHLTLSYFSYPKPQAIQQSSRIVKDHPRIIPTNETMSEDMSDWLCGLGGACRCNSCNSSEHVLIVLSRCAAKAQQRETAHPQQPLLHRLEDLEGNSHPECETNVKQMWTNWNWIKCSFCTCFSHAPTPLV